jgi:hypothetical protein
MLIHLKINDALLITKMLPILLFKFRFYTKHFSLQRFEKFLLIFYKHPILPPSTGKLIPVIYDAAGEQRNATAAPNSSGFPIFLKGMVEVNSSSISFSLLSEEDILFLMMDSNLAVRV